MMEVIGMCCVCGGYIYQDYDCDCHFVADFDNGCKYIRRDGDSCSRNVLCTYPDCPTDNLKNEE